MKLKYTFIQLYTLTKKEINRFCRIWMQTLLPPIITTNIYLYTIGYLLGKHVGLIDNVSYINYIAPGLIMMSVINSSYNNSSFSFFNARVQKSIEELLTSPISNATIILGYTIGSTLRGAITGLFVLSSCMMIQDFDIANVFFTVTNIILCAILFSLLGITNALLSKSYDGITFIPNYVLSPFIYLGGVFYPISFITNKVMLFFLALNPIAYISDIFRVSILDIPNEATKTTILVILFSISLIFLLNIHIISRNKNIVL